MDSTTLRTLLALNRRFYRRFAAGFGASRQHPWSGWRRLRALPATRAVLDGPELSVLDLGCGNARFVRFLAEPDDSGQVMPEIHYTGLDGNAALLAQARNELQALENASSVVGLELIESELGEQPGPGLLAQLGPDRHFDLVVLFGVLHHIPSEALRRQLLEAAALRLAPRGVLAVSVWRLDRQPRFERKRLPWSEHNRRAEARGEQTVDLGQLEPGDHLLTWSGERDQPRYCHFPPDEELDRWSRALAALPHPLRALARFEGDGRGDRDNLYLVWSR